MKYYAQLVDYGSGSDRDVLGSGATFIFGESKPRYKCEQLAIESLRKEAELKNMIIYKIEFREIMNFFDKEGEHTYKTVYGVNRKSRKR